MPLAPLAALLCCVLGVVTTADRDKPTIGSTGVALLGGNVTLTCDYDLASSRPAEDFHYDWLKDGQAVAEQQSRTLSLYNLSSSHQGDYMCRVLDAQSQGRFCSSWEHTLHVLVAPEVVITPGNGGVLKVREGNELPLGCQLANTPYPPVGFDGYRWDSQPVTPGQNMTSTSQTNRAKKLFDRKNVDVTKYLTYSNVTRRQGGLYTCYASNDPSQDYGLPIASASVEVQVLYLDDSMAVSQTTSKPAVAGDKVTLTCQADSVPTANLTWLHQGRVLHTVESNEDVYSFTATGCQDSGEYQCRADNDAVNKSVSAKTKVIVECPPTGEGKSQSEVEGFLGENLTLQVVISSSFPPPVYTWSGPGLKTGQGSWTMTLSNLQRNQSGVYRVNVSNQHGWLSRAFTVAVLGRATTGGGEDVAEAGADGRNTPDMVTVWLIVGAVILGVLLSLALHRLVLRKQKECRRRRNKRIDYVDEHQYAGLYLGDYYYSTGRRRNQEVRDYASGESTGDYWSIHSADLFWQPQALQPQDSLSQDCWKEDCDDSGSPQRPRMPSPKPPRHARPPPHHDVIVKYDVAQSPHPSNGTANDSPPSEDGFLPRRCGHWYPDSDQESGGSEPYCSCHVISGDPLTSDDVAV